MEHSVLTATPLFKILKQQENNTGMENAYNDFIEDVCGVCCNSVDLFALYTKGIDLYQQNDGATSALPAAASTSTIPGGET